jgi:hypothetical protein
VEEGFKTMLENSVMDSLKMAEENDQLRFFTAHNLHSFGCIPAFYPAALNRYYNFSQVVDGEIA